MLKSNIISIIGSRSCTENGIRLASTFAKELSKQDIVIGSGMAVGIDAAAHIGTLKAKGKTIAVLGSGFNNIFPKENMDLYKKIINNGGLVITEYESNIEPTSKQFLERNRIVSGLAIGILVVEAAHRSGTSVTAKLATEQGKKVFVLPHEIEDINGVGTNRLIRNGAILVTSPKEIIEEFKFLKYKEIIEVKNLDKLKNTTKSKTGKNEKKHHGKIKTKRNINEIADYKKQETRRKKHVKKEYQEIYDLIYIGINSIDELCKRTKIEVKQINNILFMLELEGIISKTAGGYKCI